MSGETTYSVSGWLPDGTKIGSYGWSGSTPQAAAESFAKAMLRDRGTAEGVIWDVHVMTALSGCGGRFVGNFYFRIVYVSTITEVTASEYEQTDPEKKGPEGT